MKLTPEALALIREKSQMVEQGTVQEEVVDKVVESSIQEDTLSGILSKDAVIKEVETDVKYIDLRDLKPYDVKSFKPAKRLRWSNFKHVWLKRLLWLVPLIVFGGGLIFWVYRETNAAKPKLTNEAVKEFMATQSSVTSTVVETSQSSESPQPVAEVPVETHQQKMESFVQTRLDTSVEHQVSYDELAGGYTLITITYHPNDNDKRYKDTVIYAPETKHDSTLDIKQDKIEELNAWIKAKGNTLEKNVTVKDVLALRYEHYVKDNKFISILFYNDTAFGYFTHDGAKRTLTLTTAYLEVVK